MNFNRGSYKDPFSYSSSSLNNYSNVDATFRRTRENNPTRQSQYGRHSDSEDIGRSSLGGRSRMRSDRGRKFDFIIFR